MRASGGPKGALRIQEILSDFTISDFDLTNPDKKKDPYDKYYNEYEELTTIIKLRKRLEKRRNEILEDGNAKEARKNRQDQRDSLLRERNQQTVIKEGKLAELNDLKVKDIAKKAGLEVDEYGTISFNQGGVEKFNSDDRQDFDKLLSKIKEVRDQVRDAEDAELDFEVEIDILDNEDRSAYVDFTTRIKDALIAQRQEEIDELKAINDSINDTNSQILNSMQEQLSESRQARNNEKTEQELSDKQRRLAYLQQDSSGANALEIMKLQKEIEEGQESYTDQLIDQKISELQKQNDKAAKQRQEQITLMEESLKYEEKTGKFWSEAESMLAEAFKEDGNFDENSRLYQLLSKTDNIAGMSKAEFETWFEKLLVGATGADAYKNVTKRLLRMNGYQTGGLADFTGPAWLDGTKSRPEYVLSASQTEAFFSLVDVLESLKFNSPKTAQNSGDSSFDIDINVESIGSDYDVERMAEKIKGLIVDSSRYRNNNIL